MPLNIQANDVVSAAMGAGLEVAFSTFLESIYELIKQNVKFKPAMRHMAARLESMRPEIKRIVAADGELDRPQKIEGLIQLMKKGCELVGQCSRIGKYNFIKKPLYLQKLNKLESKISKYLKTDMQLQMRADGAETLVEVKLQGDVGEKILDGVNLISKQLSHVNIDMSPASSMQPVFSLSSSLASFSAGCSPPSLKVDPVGLEISKLDLKRKFLKEEVPLIVLSAPGGCGKTTLATLFCQDPDVQGKYSENIFFVTVSKEPDLEDIVHRLFRHKGQMVPAFRSEEDMLNQLESLLKQIVAQRSILLVLDDVWSESEDLLDKLKFRIENYHILVTSRYEFIRFGSTFKLQTLNEEDAISLFCQSAGLLEGKSSAPDQNAMNEIVKGCKGFPLAISVIGKSLYGRPAAEWRKRAKECSASILTNFDKELLHRLQVSVDALDDAVRECFLDLGSFPEDHRIPVSTLVDIWVGSQDLEEDNAITYLHKLCNLNLVDLTRKDTSELDGFHSLQFVKQHDLLRELAILHSERGAIESRKRLFMDIRGNEIPELCAGQNKPLINANFLSISTDKKFKASSWCCMQAPRVEVFVLNFQSENYVLPDFMKTMHNLRVLIVTNYGLFPVELDNFPLPSRSNLKRIRLEKVSITSSFVTSLQLDNLEKISLVMCNIGEAFSNLEIQIPDALPNLVELNVDYCNDMEELPAGFWGLIRLQKLSITNCHKLTSLPEDIGKLMNLEVLRLNSCIELTELPDTIGNLYSLRILDLSDCLSITQLPEEIGALSNLAKLYMVDCSNCELPESVANLRHLEQVLADEETASSWKQYQYFLPDLKIKVHKDINLNWLH